MEELPRDEVERVARLAGLELSDRELSRLAGEMAAVLRHVEEIRRLGGEGDPPEEASGGEGPFRTDRVGSDPLHRPVRELAPEWRDGHFVVPRLPALDEREGAGEDRDPAP